MKTQSVFDRPCVIILFPAAALLPLYPPIIFCCEMSYVASIIQQHELRTSQIHDVFVKLLMDRDNCRQKMELWESLRDLLMEPCAASREFLGKKVYFHAFVAMVAQMYPSHFSWFQSVHYPHATFPEAEMRFLSERRGYRQPCALMRTLFGWFVAAEKKLQQMDAAVVGDVGEEVLVVRGHESGKRRRVRFALPPVKLVDLGDSSSDSNDCSENGSEIEV